MGAAMPLGAKGSAVPGLRSAQWRTAAAIASISDIAVRSSTSTVLRKRSIAAGSRLRSTGRFPFAPMMRRRASTPSRANATRDWPGRCPIIFRLSAPPTTTNRMKGFVSHDVFHRSLPCYKGFGSSASRFRKAASPASDHLDPLRVRRGLGVVVVVPVPPLVRRRLGIALGRVLPDLLAAEGGDVEVAPGGPHRLVAAAVDEVRAEHPLAVAEEHVMAVPFVDAEIGVEAVGDTVPGHLPAHPRLQSRDVRLRRPRGVGEGGVSGVQMGQVGDLIGAQGAAAAGMLGPAEHPGFEEGAVDDQLPAALASAGTTASVVGI